MRGGFLHNHMANRMAEALQAADWQVAAEYCIPNHGGFADLWAIRGPNQLLIEVELSADRLERDIEKARHLDPTKTLIVVPNARVNRQMTAKLRKLLTTSERQQIGIDVYSLGAALQEVAVISSLKSACNKADDIKTLTRRTRDH